MLLERVRFTLDGVECNKIGVDYEAFNGQPNFCSSPFWSCLHNQLWNFREVSQIEVAPSLIVLATFSPLISLLLQLYNYCKMNYLLIIYCQLSFSMHHKQYLFAFSCLARQSFVGVPSFFMQIMNTLSCQCTKQTQILKTLILLNHHLSQKLKVIGRDNLII